MTRHSMPFRRCTFLSAAALVAGALHAFPASAAMSEEEMFFKGVADVNEGELHFLAQAPEAPVHHHQNRIVVTAKSLVDGWVRLAQCHSHLDAVPSLQITYGADRIRDIRVTRAENIGRAWVEGPTVQLENIARGATVCIEAESRALVQDGQGGFHLKNGPYMRRFLDGYYPMRVSMEVRFQASGLAFQDIEPATQPGFAVHVGEGEVGIDTLFEGRLNTLIRFTGRPGSR